MFGILSLIALGLIQEPPFPTEPLNLTKFQSLGGKEISVPTPMKKATVVMFVTVDCPIANRYVPEMKRIANEYQEKQVAFLLVYVDPYLSLEEVHKHRQEFEITIDGVFDEKHILVKALGATITPQAVIVGSDGMLKYRGRIDDTYVEHGRPRERPTRQDLRIALDEVIAGRPVSQPITRSIGCDIPDRLDR
jgi:thiol-disulfide isomerase/thioredoxin